MSTYDLGIWESDGPLTAAQASHIYASFCRGETPARAIRPSTAVAAFYADLTARCPDENVWAAPVNHDDTRVLLSCHWAEAEIVCGFVDRLANHHGLVLFDPQAEEVYLPEAR